MTSALSAPVVISLAPVTDADAERRLYGRLRAPEFASLALPAEALTGLLAMQYTAQSAQIAADYPSAVRELILADGVAVGRLITSINTATIRVVDVAVLPELRGVGLGTRVLTRLCEQADAAALRIELSAWFENAGAIRLYERLGFVPGDPAGGYLPMTRAANYSVAERISS